MGLQIIGEENTVSAAKKTSAITIRLSSYGKPNTTLTFSQRRSGSLISHMIADFLYKENRETYSYFIVQRDCF